MRDPDVPTPGELRLAMQVYDVIKDCVGVDSRLSAVDVAVMAGTDERYVPTAVRWAVLEVAPKGVVIASKRGRGGGYYIADGRDEKRQTLIQRVHEDRRRTLRSLATAVEVKVGLRANAKAAQVDAIQSLQETLHRQERSLYEMSEGTIAVGKFAEAMQEDEQLV